MVSFFMCGTFGLSLFKEGLPKFRTVEWVKVVGYIFQIGKDREKLAYLKEFEKSASTIKTRDFADYWHAFSGKSKIRIV